MSKYEHALLVDDAIGSLTNKALPLATPITPNKPEGKLMLECNVFVSPAL